MKIHALAVYCLIALPALAQTTCVTVTGPEIIGRDLARALPAFAGIPADSPLAPAPLPGGMRVFYPSELQSVASRFSLAVDAPAAVCFRFATETLSGDKVLEAMRRALGIPDARIELLETNPNLVPAGDLTFAREGLSAPASPELRTPVLWRGEIVYAGGRRYPIQARVRITAPFSRMVAVEALRPGAVIRPDQVRLEIAEGFPHNAGVAPSVEQIAGMIPSRPVAAGGEVRLDNLSRPNDVNRGDLVHVEVRFGAAHLALNGQAESAGHIGDVVSIRNPESSRTFRALVEARGRVIVAPNESEGN
jgi:flagella basal body P-ring formation protein FlgA